MQEARQRLLKRRRCKLRRKSEGLALSWPKSPGNCRNTALRRGRALLGRRTGRRLRRRGRRSGLPTEGGGARLGQAGAARQQDRSTGPSRAPQCRQRRVPEGLEAACEAGPGPGGGPGPRLGEAEPLKEGEAGGRRGGGGESEEKPGEGEGGAGEGWGGAAQEGGEQAEEAEDSEAGGGRRAQSGAGRSRPRAAAPGRAAGPSRAPRSDKVTEVAWSRLAAATGERRAASPAATRLPTHLQTVVRRTRNEVVSLVVPTEVTKTRRFIARVPQPRIKGRMLDIRPAQAAGIGVKNRKSAMATREPSARLDVSPGMEENATAPGL